MSTPFYEEAIEKMIFRERKFVWVMVGLSLFAGAVFAIEHSPFWLVIVAFAILSYAVIIRGGNASDLSHSLKRIREGIKSNREKLGYDRVTSAAKDLLSKEKKNKEAGDQERILMTEICSALTNGLPLEEAAVAIRWVLGNSHVTVKYTEFNMSQIFDRYSVMNEKAKGVVTLEYVYPFGEEPKTLERVLWINA